LNSRAQFSNEMVRCSLLEKGDGKPFKPGDRREASPEWDKDKCIRCGLCYVYCPDGAIYRADDGYFEAELDKCKGCGICHRECWFGAVTMVMEG